MRRQKGRRGHRHSLYRCVAERGYSLTHPYTHSHVFTPLSHHQHTSSETTCAHRSDLQAEIQPKFTLPTMPPSVSETGPGHANIIPIRLHKHALPVVSVGQAHLIRSHSNMASPQGEKNTGRSQSRGNPVCPCRVASLLCSPDPRGVAVHAPRQQ